MKSYHSIFFRITIIIAFLVIPIVSLHFYTYYTSVSTIRNEVMTNKENQLFFLKDQIENTVERFSIVPGILAQDSSVLLLQSSFMLQDPYLTVKSESQLREKMYLQRVFNTWENDISLYFVGLNRVISTSRNIKEIEMFNTDNYGKWEYCEEGQSSYYRLLYTEPFLKVKMPTEANLIIEIRFKVKNIQNLLMKNQSEGQKGLFLYTSTGAIIGENDTNNEKGIKNINEIIAGELKTQDQFELVYEDQNLLVSYFYLPQLDSYLFDYTPIEEITLPISKTRTLFNGGISLLLVLTIIAMLLLYRSVQQPIRQLVIGLSHYKEGGYSFRIKKKYNNELDYVIDSFNEVGVRVQHLIENISEEKSRSKLASIKQLQSQINPHFLYNCLAFISSSTKVGSTKSVIDMTHHLADYFRYTTDVENQHPILKEEKELIHHYLEIYKMRLERLEYEINIPNEMLNEEFLRLTLQPIVENAIIHGVEMKAGKGLILVNGYQEETQNLLIVEDNGFGVSDEQLEYMQKNLDMPPSQDLGVGIHNVHQRLKYHFGENSGIFFSHSKHGGLSVELRWNRE